MDTDAYADAVHLRGSLCSGEVVDTDRIKKARSIVAKETSAAVARRQEGVTLKESQRKQNVDEALDDALAGTFPASDPVALDVLR